MKTELTIKLPKGFMNCGVTVDNHFIADTNDSQNWDTLKLPLPKGEWSIKTNKGDGIVILTKLNNKIMKRLAKDLEEMFLKEYKWGRIMTSNQIGLMIGWGTCTTPSRKYITIEVPFLIVQIYVN